jgi:hypothetical protein
MAYAMAYGIYMAAASFIPMLLRSALFRIVLLVW